MLFSRNDFKWFNHHIWRPVRCPCTHESAIMQEKSNSRVKKLTSHSKRIPDRGSPSSVQRLFCSCRVLHVNSIPDIKTTSSKIIRTTDDSVNSERTWTRSARRFRSVCMIFAFLRLKITHKTTTLLLFSLSLDIVRSSVMIEFFLLQVRFWYLLSPWCEQRSGLDQSFKSFQIFIASSSPKHDLRVRRLAVVTMISWRVIDSPRFHSLHGKNRSYSWNGVGHVRSDTLTTLWVKCKSRSRVLIRTLKIHSRRSQSWTYQMDRRPPTTWGFTKRGSFRIPSVTSLKKHDRWIDMFIRTDTCS